MKRQCLSVALFVFCSLTALAISKEPKPTPAIFLAPTLLSALVAKGQ